MEPNRSLFRAKLECVLFLPCRARSIQIEAVHRGFHRLAFQNKLQEVKIGEGAAVQKGRAAVESDGVQLAAQCDGIPAAIPELWKGGPPIFQALGNLATAE